MKKILTKFFIVEINNNYPTNKLTSNQVDEIRSIDIMDLSIYKFSNIEEYRYIFVIIDNLSNYTWCLPLKKIQTLTDEFLKIRTTSKRRSIKTETD